MDQLNSEAAAEIAKTADLNLACSDYIIEELKPYTTKIKYIPHGLSKVFSQKQFSSPPTDSIEAGYVGNLFIENLNRQLLKQLIIQHPSHKFHFIGADSAENSNISAWVREESIAFVEFLKDQHNVKLHGVRPPEEVAELMDSFNILLLTYRISKDNVISNSHKILEYLASGRVIISTEVSQYKNSPLLYMCSDHASYLSMYKQISDNLSRYNNVESRQKRMAFAHQYTYEAHIKNIESLL
jgi:glycosyltransferase involved in cell wall biosynthesis